MVREILFVPPLPISFKRAQCPAIASAVERSTVPNIEMATLYQTKEWAEMVSNINQAPLFLKFVDNKGKIISQLLITITSRLSKKGIIGKLVKNLSRNKSLSDGLFIKKLIPWLSNFSILNKKTNEF